METVVLELALVANRVRKDCQDEGKRRHFLETSRVFAFEILSGSLGQQRLEPGTVGDLLSVKHMQKNWL